MLSFRVCWHSKGECIGSIVLIKYRVEVADYVPESALKFMNLGDGVSFEVTKV